MLEMSQSFPGLQAQVAGLHLIFLILAVPSTWDNIFQIFAWLPLSQSDAKSNVNFLKPFPENFSRYSRLLSTSSFPSYHIIFTFYIVLFNT